MDETGAQPLLRKPVQVYRSFITRKYIPTRPWGRQYEGFVLILDGETHYAFSDGHDFTARPGDVLYLAQGDRYAMDVRTERYSFICADFMFDWNAKGKSCLLPGVSQEIRGEFRRLETVWETRRCGWQQETMGGLCRIHAALLRQRAGAERSDARRESVVAFLGDHLFSGPCGEAELARAAGVSVAQLRRLFLRWYGQPPVKVLARLRLERAMSLLQYQVYTVSEVAAQCGYGSVYYFSRCFRALTGMTPTQYRAGLNGESVPIPIAFFKENG